jgi:hypothetical protein
MWRWRPGRGAAADDDGEGRSVCFLRGRRREMGRPRLERGGVKMNKAEPRSSSGQKTYHFFRHFILFRSRDWVPAVDVIQRHAGLCSVKEWRAHAVSKRLNYCFLITKCSSFKLGRPISFQKEKKTRTAKAKLRKRYTTATPRCCSLFVWLVADGWC